MRFKIDLNWQFKDLDGKDMEGESVGSIVATWLTKAQENENFLKYFDWGLAFHRKQVVELDKTDFELLKKFIKGAGMFVFAKAQIINYLDSLKDTQFDVK